MVLAIVLSLAAGFCTAMSPVCQRLGARSLDAREPGVTGFDLMLVFRLPSGDLISSHLAAGASGTPRRDRSPMELMRKSR